MLIGILACSFCGEFSNRHGSRTPSISPQERSPQQTKMLLVLALGSFVTIAGAMYRTLGWHWGPSAHESEIKPLVLLALHKLAFPVGPGELGMAGDSAGGMGCPYTTYGRRKCFFPEIGR